MPRTSITKWVEWDMGHRVPNHESKCCNPHGHRYRCEIEVEGDIIIELNSPEQGMITDFGFLKAILLTCAHDPLDHGFMIWEGDGAMMEIASYSTAWKWIIVPYVPTAENIANALYVRIANSVKDKWGDKIKLARLTIWETPTSTATVSI